MKRLWTFLAVSAIAVPLYSSSPAEARIIYSTEEGVTNANTFILDADGSSVDDGDDIVLQFGENPGAPTFTYDNTNGYFRISDDLDFDGNEARNMVLFSGTSTASVTSPVEGMIFWDTDDDEVYVYSASATAWILIGGASGGDATTLDGIDSTQFLRSDTSDNYTSGTLTFDSGTSLVGATGSTVNFNDADVNIAGVLNDTFTIDSDSSATNIGLSFGSSAAIVYNTVAGQFEFDDNIQVTGDIEATGDLNVGGNMNQDGNTITLNADADVDANVSLVAAQNTTGETGILRYNSTSNRWEISSDNGATWTEVVGSNLTQTLTNKTIDGDNNTITNIDFTSLKVREKSDRLSPEFPNMTLTEADGAGVSSGEHSGTLSSDRDLAERMNYYSWESRRTALNDYTVVVEWYIPEDFTDWQDPLSLSVNYLTEYATIADNALDIVIRNAANAVVGSATDLASTTWDTEDFDISAGTYNPGERLTVHLTMKSRRQGGTGAGDPAHVRVGDILFNYQGR